MVKPARLSKKTSHIKASQQITNLFEIIKIKLKVHSREKEVKISEMVSVENSEEKK